VRGYRREWLDQLTLSGEIAWGRLWNGGASPIRVTPICLVPREELEVWQGLSAPPVAEGFSGAAKDIREVLVAQGAQFPQQLARVTKLLPTHLEMGLGELIAQGAITCDSFGALRSLMVPPSRRRGPVSTVGRWSLFRRETLPPPEAEFVARQFLRRTGVVFRKVIAREKAPVPWRDLVRVYRTLEARGEIRGGRFVAGFSGEQYALPEAVTLLRAIRRRGELAPISVSAADPLNFRGILTPDERVPAVARQKVLVG